MKQEENFAVEAVAVNKAGAPLQQVLYAKTSDPGVTIGVVCGAEPSSLALLAAGVTGMAARLARRDGKQKST